MISQNVLSDSRKWQQIAGSPSPSPGGLSSNLQGAAASLLLGGSDLAGNLDQNDVNPFATNPSGGPAYRAIRLRRGRKCKRCSIAGSSNI